MKSRNHIAAAVSVLCLSLLSACGGGGGDSPAPPGNPGGLVTSFSANAGIDARTVAGSLDNFALSGGTCGGTATIDIRPATAAPPFEGVSGGYSALQISNAVFSGAACPFGSGSSTGTTYYNASYTTIGFSVVAGEYAVFAAPPNDFPATVSIGNEGTIGTLNTYTNSSKSTLTGTRTISYKVEADGSSTTTAILNIINVNRRSGDNALLSTQESRYRMAGNGALTILSIDVQFATTSTLRLIYSKV